MSLVTIFDKNLGANGEYVSVEARDVTYYLNGRGNTISFDELMDLSHSESEARNIRLCSNVETKGGSGIGAVFYDGALWRTNDGVQATKAGRVTEYCARYAVTSEPDLSYDANKFVMRPEMMWASLQNGDSNLGNTNGHVEIKDGKLLQRRIIKQLSVADGANSSYSNVADMSFSPSIALFTGQSFGAEVEVLSEQAVDSQKPLGVFFGKMDGNQRLTTDLFGVLVDPYKHFVPSVPDNNVYAVRRFNGETQTINLGYGLSSGFRKMYVFEANKFIHEVEDSPVSGRNIVNTIVFPDLASGSANFPLQEEYTQNVFMVSFSGVPASLETSKNALKISNVFLAAPCSWVKSLD